MVDFSKLSLTPSEPPKVPGLSIGVTGHRPDKLWSTHSGPGHDGYEYGNSIRVWVRKEIQRTTEQLIQNAGRGKMDASYRDSFLRDVKWQNGWEVDDKWRSIEVLCLHGGAQGADQDAAAQWYKMGLPYVVVVPFPRQDRLWPANSQLRFAKVCLLAAGIYLVSDKEPSSREEASKSLLARNVRLCQMTDELIGVWDGTRGGTSHCVNWWNSVNFGAHFTRIDPTVGRDDDIPF